jgi:hypothetical protein
MNFILSENEMCNLTGFSRRQLQDMREGSRKSHKGLIFRSKPLLTKGTDWERYGWAILYAEHVSEKLVLQKTTENTVHGQKAVGT